ncbi:TPA: hypothetical protein JG832_002499 [Enterobacter hormaechei subsp. xiangfangensis]|nr:hypothetical protein [Enterobacter hormaechei subsp. xiangfangensis]HAV1890634.1 hypothetical protein [Enterobacter hormaechei subsp. xiangfangensis]
MTETPANSGIYVAKLTSTAAGKATVKVQQGTTDIAGVATQDVTFTHKVGAIDGSKSTFTASRPTATADGSANIVMTFVAKDATGAAVTGLTDISFAKSGAAAADATVETPTESSAGTYTAKVTGTTAGSLTLTPQQKNVDIAGVTAVTVTLN